MIFGKSRRDFERLEERVAALEKANKDLLAAHDSCMDWIAKELGLCVAKATYWGYPRYEYAESPRRLATEPQPAVEPKLARCPDKPKKGAK